MAYERKDYRISRFGNVVCDLINTDDDGLKRWICANVPPDDSCNYMDSIPPSFSLKQCLFVAKNRGYKIERL